MGNAVERMEGALSELNFKAEGTNKQIANALRRQLAFYDENPLRTWRWWSGFIWGAIIVAAMNYGDVWVCVGECDARPTTPGTGDGE